jgi:hypothetical protein
MSKESIENMSIDEFIMTLRKLAMKGETGEFSSVAQIYMNSHPELRKDRDFMNKLGSVINEFDIDPDSIPGTGSPEEWKKVRAESEISQKNLNRIADDGKRLEYWEKVRAKSQELKDIADRIDRSGVLDSLIQKANAILADMKTIENSFHQRS